MMASLIATNTAKAEPATSNDSASNSDEADSDDSNAPYVPSPVKRQTKLSKNNIGRTSSPKWEHSAGQGATLVVCPMTLLHQWQTEIERSIGAADTNVILYYGTGRGDLEDDIEGAGLPVVITSYGTLASEFQKLAGADGKVSKSSRSGLFAIDWYRIILDEAHTIKSRVTNNAKACYALKGKRRWALSGTPITNRLEDLYSLLHFIKLEPWGNFSYFRCVHTCVRSILLTPS
jgi:DNA repair protein RAD5